MLGGPLDRLLELKARGRPVNAKRTAQEADLEKGLAQRKLALANFTAERAERVLQDITNSVPTTGDAEGSVSASRVKKKSMAQARKRADRTEEDFVPALQTDTAEELSSQASSFISSSTIPQARSLRSSPPPLRGVSTQDLAGVFLRSTTPREDKRNAVQEELLVQMRRQAEALEELVDVVKDIRGKFLDAI
jgi:hypothetical protein